VPQDLGVGEVLESRGFTEVRLPPCLHSQQPCARHHPNWKCVEGPDVITEGAGVLRPLLESGRDDGSVRSPGDERDLELDSVADKGKRWPQWFEVSRVEHFDDPLMIPDPDHEVDVVV